MTLLPLESKNIRGVDGKTYDPLLECAHPHCKVTGRENLEKHELWPRNFLRGQPIEWVDVPNWGPIPNQVYLCNEFQDKHHWEITTNRARIELWESEFMWVDLQDDERRVVGLLKYDYSDVSPPKPDSPSDDIGVGEEAPNALEELTEAPTEIPAGKPCPTCKRRVPHPRKQSSPESHPLSFGRAPKDEVDSLKQMAKDVAEGPAFTHLKYPQSKVIEVGLVLLTQLPEETLKAIVAERWSND